MRFNKRERILAALVGLVVVAGAAHFVFSVLAAPTGSRWDERDRLLADIERKKLTIERGQKALARMTEWEKRSLPADHELGRSLYQNWLSELVDKVGFGRSRVESGEGRTHQNAYRLFPFTVRGQATTDKLVQFLYAFYRAGHLHQIRHLSIKPIEKGRGLDLVITIEALSLPGAKSDKLCTEPGTRLAHSGVEEYETTIVRRDLFSPYRPESTSTAPVAGALDPAKYTYLTAVLSVGGRPQAWIVVRATDQVYKLSEGQEFSVGPVHSKILRIRPREVDFEIDGTPHTVALGTSLRDGRRAESPEGEANSNAEATGNTASTR